MQFVAEVPSCCMGFGCCLSSWKTKRILVVEVLSLSFLFARLIVGQGKSGYKQDFLDLSKW